jgi:nitrogen-specific signal transduction histidine kinase
MLIPMRVMSKLFGKLITGSDHGTGLGLNITKKLVEVHDVRMSGLQQ